METHFGEADQAEEAGRLTQKERPPQQGMNKAGVGGEPDAPGGNIIEREIA